MSKKKFLLDGIEFDSKYESTFWLPLKQSFLKKEIQELHHQFITPIMVNGEKIGRYTWDFKIVRDSICYLIEAKGFLFARDVFRLKAAKASVKEIGIPLMIWQKPRTKKQVEDNLLTAKIFPDLPIDTYLHLKSEKRKLTQLHKRRMY